MAQGSQGQTLQQVDEPGVPCELACTSGEFPGVVYLEQTHDALYTFFGIRQTAPGSARVTHDGDRVVRGVDVGPFSGDDIAKIGATDAVGAHDILDRSHTHCDATTFDVLVPRNSTVRTVSLTRMTMGRITGAGDDEQPAFDDTVEYDVPQSICGGDDDIIVRWNLFYAGDQTGDEGAAHMWRDDLVPNLDAVLHKVPLVVEHRVDDELWAGVDGWGPAVFATMFRGDGYDYTYACGADGPGWVLRVTVSSPVPLKSAVVRYVAEIMDRARVDFGAFDVSAFRHGDGLPVVLRSKAAM